MRTTIVALVLGAMATQVGMSQEPLTLVRSIELPHVQGRIDHLAYATSTGSGLANYVASFRSTAPSPADSIPRSRSSGRAQAASTDISRTQRSFGMLKAVPVERRASLFVRT